MPFCSDPVSYLALKYRPLVFLQLHQSVSSEVVLWAKGGNALLTFLVHGLRMVSRMGEVREPIDEPVKGGSCGCQARSLHTKN